MWQLAWVWNELHTSPSYVTWKRRMIVQIRPRVRRWFPSTMSCEPMFSRWTFCSLRNCRALSTFSKQWIRMRPLVGFGCGEHKKKVGTEQNDHTLHEGERNEPKKTKLREANNLSSPQLVQRARDRVKTQRGGFSVTLTSCSPERTSRRRISILPSRRSAYKSPMRHVTRPKWEFTHLVKVFFCTASRSSAKFKDRG